MAKPIHAQLPPSFTVQFEEHPYDLPPVYGKDQFTGANITVQEGQHVLNQTITVTIKNQPFTSFNRDNYYLYYNVRAKGHFAENWNEFYPSDSYHGSDPNTYSTSLPHGFLSQTNSIYTVATLPANYPSGSQVDFQVESIIWRGFQYFVPDTYIVPTTAGHYEQRFAFYQSSGWANAQTITIPAPSPSPSPTTPNPITSPSPTPTQTHSPSPSLTPTPSPSPSIPEFPTWTILPALLIISAFVVAAIRIKRVQPA